MILRAVAPMAAIVGSQVYAMVSLARERRWIFGSHPIPARSCDQAAGVGSSTNRRSTTIHGNRVSSTTPSGVASLPSWVTGT
jgi:hypothetical protein